MKHPILIIALLFVLTKITIGQAPGKFFFDEVNISINRTTLQNDNSEYRYGFGLGLHHAFMADKPFNLIVGMEYNQTRQFIKSTYEGHFAHATDVTYKINYISMPFGIRLNAGSKTKVFVETGGYVDLMIKASRSGTMHTYLPNTNIQLNNSETAFKGKANLSSSVGVYVGFGLRIPISQFEIIIKPEYKFGLNEIADNRTNLSNSYFRLNVGLKIN